VDDIIEGVAKRWGGTLVLARIKLLIIGAGGHGQCVAEAAELSGQFEIVGFLDDACRAGECVLGYPVLGALDDIAAYASMCIQVAVAIGNNMLRASLFDKLKLTGLPLATIVHPKAIVSPHAQLGAGSTVMAGAIIGAHAKLGIGSIVNCGAVVDHHACVGDFGHLGVGSLMAGGARLGAKAWIQPGSVVSYGAEVMQCSVMLPGATLSKNGEVL
jgi:sugar O-acyltransferase (sialic acid O-acetyltransferase NeuD family)